jgi:hypothetical protein
MEYIFNKPKVFLSHSKKDIEFIKRLDGDLRHCNIETWFDEVEIPHGKSWQSSIFEYGIPTCDAIIVYLTEHSIESPIVRKEIDVALLQNLSDSNIAFLPYVNKNELRAKLRPDIQSLQTKEWNEQNYQTFLPSVVANIWQNYLKKTIATAILNERYKITQLELEIEKRKNQDVGVFPQNENTEFEYLYKVFNENIRTELKTHIPDEPDIIYILEINLLSLIVAVSQSAYFYGFVPLIQEACEPQLNSLYPNGFEHSDNYEIFSALELNLTQKMLLYGLIENGTQHIEFANKIHRFKFWLSYTNKLPENFSVAVVAL